MWFLSSTNNNFYWLRLGVLICAALIFVQPAKAAPQKPTSLEQLTQIQTICTASPNRCLANLDQIIADQKINSRVWYKLILLKMDALYALEKIVPLATLIQPWVDNSHAPIYFQISVYTYHAKILNAQHHTELSKQYLDKALKLMNETNASFPNPMILLRIANLQMVFPDQYQAAYNTMIDIQKKFSRSQNPEFQMTLYNNLASFAYHQKLTHQFLDYCDKAYFWAKKFGNIQQLGVMAYNLARAFDIEQRLLEATTLYKTAIDYAQQANDYAVQITSKLYLAKLKLNQNQITQARFLFDSIDSSKVLPYRKAMYLQVQQALSSTTSENKLE